jgi:hypothetical protein
MQHQSKRPEQGREPRWDLTLSSSLRGLEGNHLDHQFDIEREVDYL